MKAIQIHAFGDPEVMQLNELPDLQPNAREVLVEVKAAGVNPVDCYIRSGDYAVKPNLPYIPGFDGAGIVKALGKGCKRFKRNDCVYCAGSITGTYAQQALCHEDQIFPLSKRLSFPQGAAIGIPYATAYLALYQKAQGKKGQMILIHGASGGVGLACLQLAQISGLKIIATAGTPEGCCLLQEQGADFIFNHRTPDYAKAILEVTQGRGVDIILEMAAHINLNNDLMLAARKGRIIIIGCRDAIQIQPRLLMVKEIKVQGVLIFNLTQNKRREIYQKLNLLFNKGSLNPIIGKEVPLSQAAQAHQDILKLPAYAKTVLIP